MISRELGRHAVARLAGDAVVVVEGVDVGDERVIERWIWLPVEFLRKVSVMLRYIDFPSPKLLGANAVPFDCLYFNCPEPIAFLSAKRLRQCRDRK